jgi:hypothetical protein
MGTNLAISIRSTIKIGIFLSIAVGVLAIANSSIIYAYPYIGTAVTIDLLFTLPAVYFLFIRRTSIPKISVVPVFLLCLLAASAVLPANDRVLFSIVATYGVPAVELFVLGYLGFRIYRTRRVYASETPAGRDLMERLRVAFTRELRPAIVARAAAFEVGVFILLLLKWRRPKGECHTYHRTNGPTLLLVVFLFLLAAETAVVHVLLDLWSSAAAWIATALSIYFAIQLVAHLKALCLRPIVVTGDELLLRCGILGDAAIRLSRIADVKTISNFSDDGPHSIRVTPLGQLSQPNVRIELTDENVFYGIYGIEKRFRSIAFFVDDPVRLIEAMGRRP